MTSQGENSFKEYGMSISYCWVFSVIIILFFLLSAAADLNL